MQVCFLTKTESTYGLPVIRVFTVTARGFVAPSGVMMTSKDLQQRTAADLRTHGVAHFEELRFDEENKIKIGHTDALTGWGVVRTPEVVDKSVESLRAPLLARVEGLRTQKIGAGIEIPASAPIKSRTFGSSEFVTLSEPTVFVLQSDPYSQDRVKEAAIGAIAGLYPCDENGDEAVPGTGTHFVWTMRDNTDLLIPGANFFMLIPARFGLHVNTCHSVAKAHKVAIGLLETPEDIAGYDLSLGWPTVASSET
jgi:hypothetical protein